MGNVFKGKAFGRFEFTAATLVLALSARPALAEYPVTTLATLLDRVQIEDMLVEYYGNLGAGHRDFGSFYTEDGVLDVNGIESRGKKAIDDLYAKLEQPSPMPRGTLHMLLTNPVIRVDGDSATAEVVWTGIISDAVKAPPRLVEQGRERDELVKLGGHWFIKHRWITSDSGLPTMFEKTYKQR
ncbi:MAG TPA: nuclear transport factor 2 family protein [Steroidobacteraceae bacterium]|nr:nuclear transport factor 2 family protein [Steroidobacteraceae bacterium]